MTDEIPRIQVTGLYEDLEAGLRSKVLMECVHAGMNLPVRFKLDFWRFDWLRERSLRNIALSTARNSALVIVSATRARQLPDQVEKWISAWAQEKNGYPSTMIALLPKGPDGRPRCQLLHERLRRAARQKHADFFSECFAPQTQRRWLDGRKSPPPLTAEGLGLRDNRAASEFISRFGRASIRARWPLPERQNGEPIEPKSQADRAL